MSLVAKRVTDSAFDCFYTVESDNPGECFYHTVAKKKKKCLSIAANSEELAVKIVEKGIKEGWWEIQIDPNY